MSYTANRDGYEIEGAFADESTLDSADDTAYLLGWGAAKQDWPDTVWELLESTPAVNSKELADGDVYKAIATTRGMLTYGLQNGIPIWLTMGKSATPGGGPPHTHTITPTTDGSFLPSIVLHHEETGSGTPEQYQWVGCKMDSIKLSHDLKADNALLMAKLEVLAKKPLDPAFALDTAPALPATANDVPYTSDPTRNWDTGDTDTSIDGLEKIEITVSNALLGIYKSATTDWAFPWMFLEGKIKFYQIDLWYHPDTIEREMWDEMVGTTITKHALFKWTRSANDYIQLTATDCAVIKNSKHTEEIGKHKIEHCILRPRALSWEVKDSIAGGFYGE